MSEAKGEDTPEPEPTFEELVAACPIHQWAGDITDYFDRAQVSAEARRPFQELLIARGQYPIHPVGNQLAGFGARAVKIIADSGLQPVEAHMLKALFSNVVSQWMGSGANQN